MNIRYSPAARADLREISHYYGDELELPEVADRIIASILKRTHLLVSQPSLGFSLTSKLGIETPLRGLVAGQYLVAYRVDGNVVRVARVLDTRMDYLAILMKI